MRTLNDLILLKYMFGTEQLGNNFQLQHGER